MRRAEGCGLEKGMDAISEANAPHAQRVKMASAHKVYLVHNVDS